ncbi:Thivi_2564 family membrane protein [Sinorhizobium medicae]|uniref:Thivi_2564 family membrane protein n=1 Tax=Sinorhizobium medicae TaxID=110321 RepID=UPI002AF6B2FF|nr:Thivi_2564 family membrane protein [Sinorhizobium medicae]WQO47057.1 Thivi_2564 family membrane protein [Sinorhizobium medicae]WQO74423.1 Thivi_2564 family membrane protein [Sinorhizobium medicae]
MSAAISILVTILFVVVVLYLVQKLPIDSTMKQMAQMVVLIVGVSLLISLGVF